MKTEIKTKRLTLCPMSDAEIEALIERTPSDELRAAYGEMLSGGKSDPGNRVWYAPWSMVLKDAQEYVGDLGFKGPVKKHAVEIGYGVLPEYEGLGYTTEAVQAMTQWAFQQKDVVLVEAETDPENKASQRVLEKCGFVPDGTTGGKKARALCWRARFPARYPSICCLVSPSVCPLDRCAARWSGAWRPASVSVCWPACCSTMPQRKNVKSSGSSAGLMCDFFRILLLTWKL